MQKLMFKKPMHLEFGLQIITICAVVYIHCLEKKDGNIFVLRMSATAF